eukprot:CAMPEP_0195288110 /NCGR_PEP_ID=MMETSP0707-20130614/4906_1 /TAXON_ID=33640 /ORGANISM="Asterionellopsis glacialis, Strain CCMP134" /LENGTH=541 /DNA_ID=CAMNT_0040347935 /DNA_START=712 /DNA_END=2337 /DNA_ORIENTATION=-
MAEEHEAMDVTPAESLTDLFDHEPTKMEKIEMRKATKPPSEWLRLLCGDWAAENYDLVQAADGKFVQYKGYLKGMLASQLLVRLSLPPQSSTDEDTGAPPSQPPVDFWGILGIQDEFDKAYIAAQVDKFSQLYSIRGPIVEDQTETATNLFPEAVDAATAAAAAAAGITVSPSGGIVNLSPYLSAGMDANAAAAGETAQLAAAAAAAAAADVSSGKLSKKQAAEVSKAHKMAKDAEKALEAERRSTMKREQRRLSQERREIKAREREAAAVRKATERATREATREERRQKKAEIRKQREHFAQEQKNAALKRAAELVASNRVPIEITRGAAAAKAAAQAAVAATGGLLQPPLPEMSSASKKQRSCIVVSTASDLHQIVTHSKNLWTKYNAIAKEHNQKVNWITVAKELGIHVKVREKYARMHSRAEQRGFDWEKHGYWKIKDHPEIFLEPTQAEQKAKMPPPTHAGTTVLIDGSKEVSQVAEEAVAAAAAVVDATGVKDELENVVPPTDEQTAAAAAVAATLVADPTAQLVSQQQTEVAQI